MDDVYGYTAHTPAQVRGIVLRADRPWAWAGDGGRLERIRCYDTPEEIAHCQSCRLPECTNCLFRGGGKREEKWARFHALHERGLTDGEIAAAMGVSEASVYRRRKRCGLPPNHRAEGDPCPACYSREVCGRMRGSCKARRAWEERA